MSADLLPIKNAHKKPTVHLSAGNKHIAVFSIQQHIAASEQLNIFRQSDLLVQLFFRDGKPIVNPLTKHTLANELGKIIDFKKENSKGDGFACDCPKDIAQTIIELKNWPDILPLNGITNHKTIRSDGSIISEFGYDKKSGLFINIDPSNSGDNFQISTPKQGRSNAEQALNSLNDLISDFPFSNDCSRAAALSMVITSIIRASLRISPAFAITAPTPGTGKTTFCENILLLAHGNLIPVIPLEDDPKEANRVVSSALQARTPALFFDNITMKINWRFLMPILTSDYASFRIFGLTKMSDVPTNVMVICNGNNLSIVGDLVRRFIVIDFDSEMENPEQRSFSRNLPELIKKNRTLLIDAVLTVISEYLLHGSLDKAKNSGFPEWDKFVRFPLLWLGLPDPLYSIVDSRNNDPEVSSIAAMCEELIKVFGFDGVFTASEIILKADISINNDLNEALIMACGDRHTAAVLGGWLNRFKDRPVNGYKIIKASRDKHKKRNAWQIARIKQHE